MIMLLTILFMICLFSFVGNLIGFAFKFSWGLIKVAFYLIFLPVILVGMLFYELIYVAFPLLLAAMLIGLFVKKA